MKKPGEQGKALEDGEHAQQSPQEETQHLACSSDDGRLAGRRAASGVEWIHRSAPGGLSQAGKRLRSNLPRVHGLASPVYWLLRRWTGYRLYHLLAFVAVLVLVIGGMAIPFWWLGEQAGNVAGVAGVVIVSLVYLYAAVLVLAFSAIVVARLLVSRLRRLVGPRGARPHQFAGNERRRP
jgi:hypothetical protein